MAETRRVICKANNRSIISEGNNLPIPTNNLFKDHPGAKFDPPWEAFWDCRLFATDECLKDCNKCDKGKANIDNAFTSIL